MRLIADPTPINDPDLLAFAGRTLSNLYTWFGHPCDPTWPVVIVYGGCEMCGRNRILREYSIVLRGAYPNEAMRLAALAHELYHRATMIRRGLRSQLWIDEMLAFLTSQRILELEGAGAYAEQRFQHLHQRYQPLDLHVVQSVRTKRRWFGPIEYPIGFSASVARLGVDLQRIVGWRAACSLVAHSDFADWLASLPADRRAPAATTLGIPLQYVTIPP